MDPVPILESMGHFSSSPLRGLRTKDTGKVQTVGPRRENITRTLDKEMV